METSSMYDIKWIRSNREAFDRGLVRRGLEPAAERLLQIYNLWRAAASKLQDAQTSSNTASTAIGQAKAKKDEATAQALIAQAANLKSAIPAMESEEKAFENELDAALAEIPNLPLD